MRLSFIAAIHSDVRQTPVMLDHSLEALAGLVVVGDHGGPFVIVRVLLIQLEQLVAHIHLGPPGRKFTNSEEPNCRIWFFHLST